MLITIHIQDKTAATLGISSCDIVYFKQIPVHITGLLPFDLHTNDKPELPYVLQVTAYYCNIKKTDIVIKYDLVSNEFYYSGYLSNHGLSENHFFIIYIVTCSFITDTLPEILGDQTPREWPRPVLWSMYRHCSLSPQSLYKSLRGMTILRENIH